MASADLVRGATYPPLHAFKDMTNDHANIKEPPYYYYLPRPRCRGPLLPQPSYSSSSSSSSAMLTVRKGQREREVGRRGGDAGESEAYTHDRCERAPGLLWHRCGTRSCACTTSEYSPSTPRT